MTKAKRWEANLRVDVERALEEGLPVAADGRETAELAKDLVALLAELLEGGADERGVAILAAGMQIVHIYVFPKKKKKSNTKVVNSEKFSIKPK